MHMKLIQMQLSLVNRHVPIFLHDNTRPRTSTVKLTELKYEILLQPPFSLDLPPADYHIFRHLELFLKNKTFHTRKAVIATLGNFILSKNESFHKNGI